MPTVKLVCASTGPTYVIYLTKDSEILQEHSQRNQRRSVHSVTKGVCVTKRFQVIKFIKNYARFCDNFVTYRN